MMSFYIRSRKKEIIQRVCDAKLKEIRLELDGFLVHDLGLVPHLNKVINPFTVSYFSINFLKKKIP